MGPWDGLNFSGRSQVSNPNDKPPAPKKDTPSPPKKDEPPKAPKKDAAPSLPPNN